MLAKGHCRILAALALALALPAMAQAGASACDDGKIQAGGECVDKERAASEIEKIVRKIMTDNDLKAVIAGVSVAGQPVLTKTWGESMTGVPATYDMHFRNGSVAIAYLGVVALQLQEKGVLRLDDKLAKWFPEDATYWDPSWTLARGAAITSNVADTLKSVDAIGTGALLSPDSFKLQLAPTTAKLKPWNEQRLYGLGIFVIDGWLVQNPSFAGYAATMAYLPAQKLAIVVSATEGMKAPDEGNLSTVVLKDIAGYLAPDHPMK